MKSTGTKKTLPDYQSMQGLVAITKDEHPHEQFTTNNHTFPQC
ncbi:hypothetical protein L289_2611 [Acinetobacter gerneri DSM 14967 = CIP 107464 = MTCC 9824]|uniref:Uncharacterized protein n=1 Tax=Acinetobacter gerneri DSM 14967 = CIP 107464 = MTCC 9824 TaxID=1120926 RepID=N8YD98_9GAMM|nr:hypothetical protein F960_01299 [Acinetobacter gerneri DSM 14967 = CIP 107464 = MTCC 9824]EPR82886.1 hypothetical protein L289_2611 [Acinetobacter gerneri DSM 14967 = CIP 107464 = MTCC 9824]